jgi:osmoprotectant transport system substrate-binding protein
MARFRFFTALTYAALSAAACSSAVAQALVVGSKEFTEQLLVAEMTTQLLRARGFSVHTGTRFATEGLRTFQEAGIVDLYWEYTGTALMVFHQDSARSTPEEAYQRVKALDAPRRLIWLAASKVNNTYSLAMRREDAAERGIASISDLAAKIGKGEAIRVASTPEFPGRPDGLKPLQQTYGFEFMLGNVVRMEAGAVYAALRRGRDFDVGVVFATDGRISAFDLAVLRDDRRAFPNYIMAPVIRQSTLERHPSLKPILESLSTALDNDTMRALNASVDLQGRNLEDVAAEFLRSRGLVQRSLQ